MSNSGVIQSPPPSAVAAADVPSAGHAAPLSITDEGLLERVRRGDAEAGDALVRRHAEPLLRYLRRLAGDDHAEELHQQTWLSVLDNLDRFDPGAMARNGAAGANGTAGASGTAGRSGAAGPATASPFKAWLFRIATNKANDLWRSRGRERAAKEGLRLTAEATAPWAGAAAEGSEEARRLMRAIGQLPESQKQVLALRYYSNMKFVDIANLLGCPLNTALGRVHKAMNKLRQLLEE